MTPIIKLYWIRVALGIISGAASSVVAFLLHNPNDITTFVNAFTIALIVYLVTYYILKAQFKNKIEKQSKILKHSNNDVLFLLASLSSFYSTLAVT